MSTLDRFREYVWHNRVAMVRDFVAILVWVTVVNVLLVDVVGDSLLIHYGILFGGILLYVQFVPSWERPPAWDGGEDLLEEPA